MVVTIKWARPLIGLVVGDVVSGTILVDGQKPFAATQWALKPVGIIDVGINSNDFSSVALICKAPGAAEFFGLGNGALSPRMSVTVTAAPVVVPPPVTANVPAPAKQWKGHRPLRILQTDFFYDWDPSMEKPDAERVDILISGDSARHNRMKAFNPNLKHIPYTLQYTGIETGKNLQSQFVPYFIQWCSDNHIAPVAAEKAWLHTPDGHRAEVVIWDSRRWVGDPRDPTWRRFSVWRYQEMVRSIPTADGFFIDEFGSGGLTKNYKLAQPSATDLAAIFAAETTLMAEIAKAIAPKQLIVNIGNYMFQEDIDIAKAAGGVHMEQVNVPMTLDWWASAWPFMDKLMAANVFVNVVPAYAFGEYESVKDPKGYHMDSHRGKLLEVCGAYMLLPNDPGLMALSVENGPWNKFTPITNWLYEIDADIGTPVEVRQKQTGFHHFYRRFSKGLVVVNPVVDRNPPNYGVQTRIDLPRDRKYAQVLGNGQVGSPVDFILLRTPEAAIFKVVS